MIKRWTVLCLGLTMGCAEPFVGAKLSLPVASFKVAAAEAGGVGIGVQPITAANVRNFRDLNKYAVWYEGDPNAPTRARHGSGAGTSACD